MMSLMRRSRDLALGLVGALCLQTLTLGVANAGMVGTDAYMARGASGDRATVNHYLDRAEVRDALATQGVDPEEAKARIATLSDGEVARLESRGDEEPAGGLVGRRWLSGRWWLLEPVCAAAHAR